MLKGYRVLLLQQRCQKYLMKSRKLRLRIHMLKKLNWKEEMTIKMVKTAMKNSNKWKQSQCNSNNLNQFKPKLSNKSDHLPSNSKLLKLRSLADKASTLEVKN